MFLPVINYRKYNQEDGEGFFNKMYKIKLKCK